MEPERETRGGSPVTGVSLPGDLLCLAVAHEIKNDLQALTGMLALIEQDEKCSPRAREWAARGLRIGEASAVRLRAVSGALLEQAHATVSEPREPVRSVVERAVYAVNLRDARGDARRRVVLFGDAREALTERPFLLEIAVTNLLTNAVAATPAGAPPPRVTVRAESATTWEVVVEDLGPGMPDEARRVLTGEAGALAEVDFTRASARWGVGLILVRAAAVAAGWHLEASRGGDGGSIVTMGVDGRQRGASTRPHGSDDEGTA
jgi:signal transduction histidine kinase